MVVTEETAAALKWLDYTIIGIVLFISSSIGIYYRFSGGRQKTVQEYFSANRSIGVPLLSTTLMVAFMSAISMLGISGENYIYGAQFIVITVGYVLGCPIVAYLYLPVFFRLQNMSVYEYLESRFGKIARLVASLANYARSIMSTGVVLYAPALALEATTGLSCTTSILLIGLICTFYSSIGGVKAVIATDIFQGILMFAAVLCIIAVGCYDLDGGISTAWNIADEGGRLGLFHFEIDPTVRHTWWSLMTGGMIIFVADFGINQVYVQRLLSARSLKSAQLSIFVNTPMIIVMIFTNALAGLVLYAWFHGCDPVTSGQISSFDQIMPYFAKRRLSNIPGFLGFFIAGVFSAALSTVSATLNSLAAIAVADYVKPLCHKCNYEYSDSKTIFFAKIIVFINGLLCMSIAFIASGLGNILSTNLAISGAIGGPVLGLFTLGIFVEAANEMGAVLGTVLSLAFLAWISFGYPKPPIPELPVSVDECSNSTYHTVAAYRELMSSRNEHDQHYFYLHRLSYLWYTPLGVTMAVIFGYIASTLIRRFTKNFSAIPDPDLFTPFLAARIKRQRDEITKTKVRPVFESETK